MKDDISNLKETTDLILKDIYVTDELKARTSEMCKKEKNKILVPFITAAASAVAITLSLTEYQYFSHRIDSNLINTKQATHNINNNSNITMENADKTPDYTLNTKVNQNLSKDLTKNYTNNQNKVNLDTATNISKSKNSTEKTIANNNTILKDTSTNTVSTDNDNKVASQNKILEKQMSETVLNNTVSDVTMAPDTNCTKESNSISDSIPINPSIRTVTGTLSTAEAEKYWGGAIILPSYIPSGFELTDISIPKDDKEKYVKLTYSLNNTYFKITENKSTKYNITGKSIIMNNINITITVDKNDTSNTTTNAIIIQIVLEKDNIQYLIIGNISEMELTNIVKSLIS